MSGNTTLRRPAGPAIHESELQDRDEEPIRGARLRDAKEKERPVSRDEVLALLRAHKPVLERRFGVADLALFGSFARDRAGDESDVDILVRFDGPATSKRYFGTQFYIEDLLGRSVDLATDSALRRELRPYVEREAIRV